VESVLPFLFYLRDKAILLVHEFTPSLATCLAFPIRTAFWPETTLGLAHLCRFGAATPPDASWAGLGLEPMGEEQLLC
jgi:hypothetical protein